MPRMKAVQIHRFGAEDVLQLDDIEIPDPGPREMLIKIAATSVNHSDLFIRQNGNIHIGPGDLPLLLRREIAVDTVEQKPRQRQHRIERRAKLMAHVRKKLGLEFARLSKLFGTPIQFGVERHHATVGIAQLLIELIALLVLAAEFFQALHQLAILLAQHFQRA